MDLAVSDDFEPETIRDTISQGLVHLRQQRDHPLSDGGDLNFAQFKPQGLHDMLFFRIDWLL